jgi:uncharacterized protein
MMGHMAEVKDVPDESRFEILVDGKRAGFMDYSIHGDTFTAVHTEIADEYEGQGLAAELVTIVLDRLRDTGMALRPLCPYVKRFLEKHPEYSDLVASKKGS